MEIFRLFGSIFIDDKEAGKSLQKTEKKAGKVAQALQGVTKAATKAGETVGRFGTAINRKAIVPLTALTATMFGLTKTTSDYGDKVAKTAQEVGMGVEAYQELTYVMNQNNLSAEDSQRILGRLNQRIGEARQGSQRYRDSLEKLGVSLDDLDVGLITTDDAFVQIIESLHEMDDAQLQAQRAGEIFGTRLSRSMLPFIRSGAKDIDALRRRAHELGIVMEEEATRKSEMFGDSMTDLKSVIGGLSRSIGQELLAPGINLSNMFTEIVAGITEWIRENPELVRQIVVWGGAIAGVLGVLVTLGTTLVITGKIIGALGVIFGILTSKPLLIIAAIGALYVAWESDWLGIRTAVEDAWEVISHVIDAIIEWGNKTLSTVWNWTTETASKFLTWVQETAWPWIDDTVSTAWNWSKGKVDEFVTWVKEAAWPVITKGASTAWDWGKGTVDDFITWIKDVAWPFIDGVATTAWNWTLNFGGKIYEAIKKGFDTGDWSDFWGVASDVWSTGVVLAISLSAAVQGISAVMSAIQTGLGVASAAGTAVASLGIPGLIGLLSIGIQLMEAQAEGSFESFAKNILAAGLIAAFLFPVLGPGGALAGFNLTLNLKLGEDAYDGFKVLFEWIGHNLEKLFTGKWDQFMSLDEFTYERAKDKVLEISPEEYEENLRHAIDWLKTYPEDIWDDYAEMAARIWDVDENEIRRALGLEIIEDAIDGIGTLDDLLDSIYRAEGGAKARVPYGMTGFADAGNRFGKADNQALFEQLSDDLVEGSDEYYRAAATVSITHYWDTFQAKFPNVAGKSFDQVGPEMQQMFITHLGRWFAPPDASELNVNWVPNVLKFMGHEELAEAFRQGGKDVLEAWIGGALEGEAQLRESMEYIAGIVADYMVGASPPPLGPLSEIDAGGAHVMGAWVGGAEKGLEDGMPALSRGLENIKRLFGSVWDRVPEDIRRPIERAISYIGDLIEQAEEALWSLDAFQEELDALLGDGGDPKAEAKGFMARLTAGLNEQLDKLSEPMERFTDAVWQAGGTLFEFGQVLASGNWLDAFLVILMETESFAMAMELLGKVMGPVIELFDMVLRPVIEFIAGLWNAIMRGLASISIFGWRPFKRLEDHIIDFGDDDGGSTGSDRRGTGGRQVSEIAGPTRDLFVDLLSPIAHLGQIVAPIRDIRDITSDIRNALGSGLSMPASEPAFAVGGLSVTFEAGSIVVPGTDGKVDYTRLSRAIARELRTEQRGKGKL